MNNLSSVANIKKASKVRSLYVVNQLISQKRASDLLRFRTCCCDPRASK